MSNSVYILHVIILLMIIIGNYADYRCDDFPTDFVFGSGTSAYQVEGAALEDGRTFSIWDTFAHLGCCSGANGDVACDGYHKYKVHITFLNPLVNGDYPNIMKKNAGNRIPSFTKLESEMIKGSFDFFGINHYNTLHIKDNPTSLEMDIRDFGADMAATLIYNGSLITPNELPVAPLGLQKLLNYLKEEYGNPPVYIHENGQVQPRNGTLMDFKRVEYLQAYIGAMLDAIRNGSDTRGYFVWSFLDLFEWLNGYNVGYGLYYVDLDDKKLTRYPKLSAEWYTSFLKGNSVRKDAIVLNSESKDSSSQ